MLSNHESRFGAAPVVGEPLPWLIVLQESNQPDHEQQRRLQLVLEAVRAGTWEADFTAERVTWSPEVYALHGLDPNLEPFQYDAYLTRFVHPDDRAHVQATLLGLVAGEGPDHHVDLEYRVIRPDGTMIWLGAIGSIERDESGRPCRAMGISRDISSHKQSEFARRDADRFIARITEVAPTLIYVYDLETGRRLYNNGWLPQALGYEDNPDVDVKAFVDRALHPDDEERIAAYRRTHPDLPDGVVSQVEYRVRHTDGTWRWYLSRNLVFARNPDGKARELLGTTTDITAVKRAEEELRSLNLELERRVSVRTADLAAANHELEAFAYSVSHDLRAPLRAIGGFSNALIESCTGQLDANGLRYLSFLTAAVKRMAGMIEGLLALSRTARNDLLPGKVDLSAVASEVLADLQVVDIDRHVDIVIAPHVEGIGDPRLLRIVLDNLLGNAWKFTSRRDRARIEFGMQLQENEPIYFVRDNGAGFDMANAAALFAPFQRLHRFEEFEGTGVGLATVHRIIHRHGGHIWAHSEPNQGATFYFTLESGGARNASRGERAVGLEIH